MRKTKRSTLIDVPWRPPMIRYAPPATHCRDCRKAAVACPVWPKPDHLYCVEFRSRFVQPDPALQASLARRWMQPSSLGKTQE